MNSKAIGADFTYAWEDAKIGMMDGELAAKIMYADASADELAAKAKEYDALHCSKTWLCRSYFRSGRHQKIPCRCI